MQIKWKKDHFLRGRALNAAGESNTKGVVLFAIHAGIANVFNSKKLS